MAWRRSGVRIPLAPPGGLHVSVGPIFTFGSDILAPVAGVAAAVSGAVRVRRGGFRAGAGVRACCRWLWRCLVAAGCARRAGVRAVVAAGLRAARRRGRRGSCGAGARVLGGRPLAARRWFSSCRASQACRMRWLRTTSRRWRQHEGRQAHEAAPAAADVVGGGVLGGGEAAFGAGAAGVGAAVRGGGVVVFLRGLGGDLGRDGDGLLGAAGRRVLGGCEDLRAVPVQGHRGGPERAADLAHGGGALHAVVAVGVVAVMRPSL